MAKKKKKKKRAAREVIAEVKSYSEASEKKAAAKAFKLSKATTKDLAKNLKAALEAAKKQAKLNKQANKINKVKKASPKMDRCEIHLVTSKYSEIFLPVTPESFVVTSPQGNSTVNVLTLGEVNLLGQPGLKTVTIESLFPKEKYRWQNGPYKSDPYKSYIKPLENIKNKKRVIELFITGTPIGWDCTIENMEYGEQDASGDVHYKLDLKEYKKPNGRVKKKTKTVKLTVKKNQTLKKLAKKYLGSTSYAKSIYQQNKAAIEKAWKKYAKKENKKRKKWNRKHPKNKKKLLPLSSKKGKYLAVGTKLTIKQKVAK